MFYPLVTSCVSHRGAVCIYTWDLNPLLRLYGHGGTFAHSHGIPNIPEWSILIINVTTH